MIGDVLPYVNAAAWLVILGYAVRIEHRLTKLESLAQRVAVLESVVFRQRVSNSHATEHQA